MLDVKVRVSKFLSLVLRHAPETISVELDQNGWIDVDTLLDAAERSGTSISPDLLEEVVYTNDKQRFAFSDDGKRIRANQGHSIEVDLKLPPIEPPNRLFHGTATRFLSSIQSGGIQSRSRQHVHMSGSIDQAMRVGARHGKPMVLIVLSAEMHNNGMSFYRSNNGLWLTSFVPTEFFAVYGGDA